jgi:predicted nucleotidyltransferase
MVLHGIEIPEAAVADLCKRYKVARLSLFGSILTDDFTASSDVDFLVEFQPDSRASLFELGGMLMELRALLGRDVDLRTPMDISQYFRDEVLRHARMLYAA